MAKEVFIPNTGILKQNNVLARLPLNDVTNSGKKSTLSCLTSSGGKSDIILLGLTTNNKGQIQTNPNFLQQRVYVNVTAKPQPASCPQKASRPTINFLSNPEPQSQKQNIVLSPRSRTAAGIDVETELTTSKYENQFATYTRSRPKSVYYTTAPPPTPPFNFKREHSLDVFDDDNSQDTTSTECISNTDIDINDSDSDGESLADLDWLKDGFSLKPFMTSIDEDEQDSCTIHPCQNVKENACKHGNERYKMGSRELCKIAPYTSALHMVQCRKYITAYI